VGAVTATCWLVVGSPGSGKSTLGAALARTVGGALVDRDVATGPLTRVVATLVGREPDDLDDPAVRSALGDAAYEAVVDLAADNLRLGLDVVLVAPFSAALADRGAAARVHAGLGGGPLRVIRAACPPEERTRRLAARGAARDRRKLAQAGGPPESPPPAVAHAVVDTTVDLAEQVTLARDAPELMEIR
jgi:predicted kinase